MNQLSERRRKTLELGLNAFDRATRRRTARRRFVRGTLVAALVAGAALAVAGLLRHGPRPLPPYVTLIADDQQLVTELALANACERIERRDGRLTVLECARPEIRAEASKDRAVTPAT